MKRGFNYTEALAYTGVKRRTFDARWRPRLVAVRQGSCCIYDRLDLDRLFEEFKNEAQGASSMQASSAANDGTPQNRVWNERPINEKGVQPWVEKQQGSTPATMERGKSTNTGKALGFAAAVSKVRQKQKAG